MIEDKIDSDDSDDGLKIVIDSPIKKRTKAKSVDISTKEKAIIEAASENLEKSLEEKAAKANLSASKVKNIIRHVVKNEDVVALVRHVEDPECPVKKLPVYEPKLTRAKAKELFPTSSSISSIPWKSPKPSSEVQALITEELQEDSSGDEYIPGEESEDDRESSIHSEPDPLSVEPPAPKNADNSTQTYWSEDGIFKIPRAKTREEEIEEANIALRTRSKLSLSETPLEVIEDAFIPPDITTDMYDMECDDDDWKDFLKKFTRPLDEVTKEDEDHDPEYNILADEEIDKEVDREELRADKGVKVSKKELHELIAELFDCDEPFPEILNVNNVLDAVQPETSVPEGQVQENLLQVLTYKESEVQPVVVEEPVEVMISEQQKILLEQHMRQHVQMLTQQFLLLHEHPEYPELAKKCKEYLLDLRNLSMYKANSYFGAINLESSIDVVQKWEQKYKTNDPEVEDAKRHVVRTLYECKKHTENGNYEYIQTLPPLLMDTILKSDAFIYTTLLPKIGFKPPILTANKFLPPEQQLVAMGLEQFIPFCQQDPKHCTNGEVRLKIVCSYIRSLMLPNKTPEKMYRYILLQKSPKVDPNPIKHYFEHKEAPATVHYVLPLKDIGVLPPIQRKLEDLPYQFRVYVQSKVSRPAQKAPPLLLPRTPTVQPEIILQDNSSNILSVQPETFSTPASFRYVGAPPNINVSQTVPVYVPVIPEDIAQLLRHSVYRNYVRGRRTHPKGEPLLVPFLQHSRAKRKIKFNQHDSLKSFSEFNANNLLSSTPVNKPKRLEKYFKSPVRRLPLTEPSLKRFKFNSSIFKSSIHRKRQRSVDDMLPSMPMLNSPFKTSPERSCSPEPEPDNSQTDGCRSYKSAMLKDDENFIGETDSGKQDDVSEAKREIETESEILKDNLDDINALMLASSTIKTKKRAATGAEKKKARQRKEITANLTMLIPEEAKDSEEKTKRFVQAYYDKVKEQLDIHDYHRFMELLNNFEETKDSVTNLYHSVCEILNDKYPDLADEFLSFLTASQAKAVGKFVPYIVLNNMSVFLRKLEMYFRDQPSQVRKIYRGITELSECVDVTMDKIRSTILPLLRGNRMLIDWFLQIFPSEKPTESLLNGSWESIDIQKEGPLSDGEVYETITVPEVEDPYGGPNCICSCHDVEDQMFKSRTRHCIPCGTKFLQGRVYVQTGKGLRQVKVTFNNPSGVDHYSRLGCPPLVHGKKKLDASPSKTPSNNKDNQDEIRLSNDSEDETDCSKRKQQKPKTPRKRKPKPKMERTKKDKKETPPKTAKIEKLKLENDEVQMNGTEKSSGESSDLKSDGADCNRGDGMEWDTSFESVELRLSPEPSAESESGETSQDNINTDSDSSLDSQAIETGNSSGDDVWTRDEDKMILETFQREGDKEETFVRISETLENRSVAKVKSRFDTLMTLLREMASKS